MSTSSNEQLQRQNLLELQQFVLNRETDDIRCNAYEYMISSVLFNHTKQDDRLDYKQIISHMEHDYYFKDVPKLYAIEALKVLEGNHSITKNEEFYTLSSTKRSELKTNLDTSVSREQNVKNALTLKLSEIEGISKQQIEFIVSNFQLLLGSMFRNYGSQIAKIFAEESKNVQELKKYPVFQEIYSQKIKAVVAKSLHKELDEKFNDFFFKPTRELSEYFLSMAQSFVFLRILNIDPNLQKLQKITWAKKIIFLDTNVIIPLLFEGHPLHKTIELIINQTKQLGVQLFITEKTKEEFKKFLESSKKKNVNFTMKGKFASLFKNTTDDNPFLLTYIQDLDKNPKTSLNVFAKKYDHFDLLLERYSIKIEEYIPSIEDVEYLPNLRVHIVTNANWKYPEVVYHDAYNILRVHSLRKKGTDDEFGPKSWLLTIDYSLQKAEKDMYGDEKIPASITIDVWLQIIAPLISPKVTIQDTAEGFSKLLSFNFSSNKISTNQLTTLMTAFMDDSKFTVDHLKIIIGNDYIKEKLREMQELIDKGEIIKLEQFQPLLKKSVELIEEEYKKKETVLTEEHKKELQELRSSLDAQQQEIEQMKKTADVERKRELEDMKSSLEKKHVQEMEDMKKIVDNVQSDMEKLKNEKTVSEQKNKLRTTSWKAIAIVILSSAIADFVGIYGFLAYSKLEFYEKLLIVIMILCSEAGIIYFIPKIINYLEKTKNSSWTRQDKLALIGIIAAIASVIAVVLK